MTDVMRDLFFWAQSLPAFPKVIISAIVFAVAVLVLLFLWIPQAEKPITTPLPPPVQPQQQAGAPPGNIAQAPSTENAKRETTNKTARQLLALYQGRTPFQADKLIEPFKGLWIEVEGVILTILADGTPGHSIVVLKSGNDTIECRFGPKWANNVGRLDTGDTMKVRGKISTNQNGQQLYLLECEIP